ncbi:MAG: FHA domain-containing protein [Planctomycetales bacterium]|nr:FHA domain-containing protein [Planctomycetales bacterium]
MPSGSLVLVGVDGMVEGEIFRVAPGAQVVIGRSRSCDISLRKCLRYLSLDPEERDRNKHFQTVSRQHLQVSVEGPGHVELENLGANGTLMEGQKFDKVTLTDLAARPREIVLGTKERFRLEWREEEATAPKEPAAASA